jgi:hypothetical protein
MPDSVAQAYAAYLRGEDRSGLAPTLRAAGYVGLAKLLELPSGARFGTLSGAWPSVWDGRRCALGPTPPSDADPWALWFDPTEVTVMTLVPRTGAVYASWSADKRQRLTRFVGWLSLLQAGRWQVAGWARAVGEQLKLPPGPDQLAPATGLSATQARRYARYFGKTVAGRHDWTAVFEAGDPLTAALWLPTDGPQLSDELPDDRALVQTRDQALVAHVPDEPGQIRGTVVATDDPLPRVGFRTALPAHVEPSAARPPSEPR